jgi:hypothetical protein
MTHYPQQSGQVMDRRDSYLFKAAELLELSKNEHHAEFKAEFENLAYADNSPRGHGSPLANGVLNEIS